MAIGSIILVLTYHFFVVATLCVNKDVYIYLMNAVKPRLRLQYELVRVFVVYAQRILVASLYDATARTVHVFCLCHIFTMK